MIAVTGNLDLLRCGQWGSTALTLNALKSIGRGKHKPGVALPMRTNSVPTILLGDSNLPYASMIIAYVC